MVELDIKISSKDLYDYQLKHSYSTAPGIMGSTAGAIFIILAVMTSNWPVIIMGCLLLVYMPVTLYMKSKQQYINTPVFKEPLHYVLDEEGMTISQGETSSSLAWGDFHKAVSSNRSIILYTGRYNATIFPKSQLGDRKADVIEIISTHMPPEKVKIKE